MTKEKYNDDIIDTVLTMIENKRPLIRVYKYLMTRGYTRAGAKTLYYRLKNNWVGVKEVQLDEVGDTPYKDGKLASLIGSYYAIWTEPYYTSTFPKFYKYLVRYGHYVGSERYARTVYNKKRLTDIRDKNIGKLVYKTNSLADKIRTAYIGCDSVYYKRTFPNFYKYLKKYKEYTGSKDYARLIYWNCVNRLTKSELQKGTNDEVKEIPKKM